MAVIRKLNFLDKGRLKELRPFLNNDDENLFIDLLTNGLPGHLHYYLPLKYKVLNESYLMTEKDKTLGLITVGTFNGNHKKINISQLFFIENYYEIAQQLIDFVISQYGAIGATTFYMLVDDIYTELSQVLLNNCGFRQCSYEQIWEVPKISFKKGKGLKYRRFKNSDVKEVADIYNDSVITHFRPAMLRKKEEFYESNFSGLKYCNEYRYVIEDEGLSKIIAYFKISTADNKNYTVDFNYSAGYDIDYDTILYFATREILKRSRKFKLFIKMKNYIDTHKSQKEYFKAENFNLISTKNLYVKDFFKVAKEFSLIERFSTLGGLHNSPSF